MAYGKLDRRLTEEIHRHRASLRSMAVIFKLIDLVEVFDADLSLFDPASRMMHVLVRLLTFRPNHLHITVANRVVRRLGGDQFSAEEYRRDAVPFVAECGCQTVPSAPVPVLVFARRRSVPRVIIADSITRPSRRADYDVRAIHRIEIVLGLVSVSRNWQRCFGREDL